MRRSPLNRKRITEACFNIQSPEGLSEICRKASGYSHHAYRRREALKKRLKRGVFAGHEARWTFPKPVSWCRRQSKLGSANVGGGENKAFWEFKERGGVKGKK